MSAITKTTAANILAIVYNRGFIASYERLMAKFWDSVSKFQDGQPAFGQQRNWAIQTKGSHSVRVVAEGGDYPDYTAPAWLQASITNTQILGTVNMTELLGAISQQQGYIGDGMNLAAKLVKDGIKEGVLALNRQSLGYSSGRMAVVASTTDTSTTVPVSFPYGSFQIRDNMLVDFYDTDSGGSKQGNTQTVQYTVENGPSPYFTIDAARTLTAGWGVYVKGEYGIAMQGLQQVCDDGTLTSSLFSITRSSNPAINALVLSASSGLQPWSEQLVNQAIQYIVQRGDTEPDEIWSNDGMPAAQRDALAGSRIFMISGNDKGVPGYGVGYNTDDLAYNYNGKRIPYKVDRNLPARSMYIITRSLFRKHVTKELDWVGDGSAPGTGSGTPVWMQQPGSATGTYASAKVALFNSLCALGHEQPKLNALVTDVVDNLLCQDEL